MVIIRAQFGYTLQTDSTIAPPKNKPAMFINECFIIMAARHKEGCYGKNVFIYFLVCKGLLLRVVLSNHDVGVARGTVFQEIRPGAGLKTGDFVEEKLGGLQ